MKSKPKTTKKKNKNKPYSGISMLIVFLLATQIAALSPEECNKLISNCESCGTPPAPPGMSVIQVIQCYVCRPGFTTSSNNMECYDNRKVDLCLKFMAGCINCKLPLTTTITGVNSDTKPECLDCKKGMILDPVKKECVEVEKPPLECKDSIKYCLECQDVSTSTGHQYRKCIKCEENFIPTLDNLYCREDKECKTEFCEECNTFTTSSGTTPTEVCSRCKEGYTVTADGKCEKGVCNFSGCEKCGNVNGQFACIYCKPGWLTVKTLPIQCTEDKNCEENIPGCLECDFYDNQTPYCKLCKPGLLPRTDGKCYPKDDNSLCGQKYPGCLKCEEKADGTLGGCLDCIPGYKPNSDGQCEWVKPDCSGLEKCQQCGPGINGENICFACQENHFVNLEGICEEIGKRECKVIVEGCLECEFVPDRVKCHKCDEGYYNTMNHECIKEGENECTKEDPNCGECDFNLISTMSTRRVFACFHCKEGFFVNEDGKCQEEVKNECSDKDSNCLECETGSGAATEFVCKKCRSGFFVNGFNTCQKIQTTDECFEKLPGCAKCGERLYSDKPYCEKCAFGYMMMVTGECRKTNEFCNKVIPGCMKCFFGATDAIICDDCQPGFKLNNLGKCEREDDTLECGKIDPFCSYCEADSSGTIKCLKCFDGYFLNKDSKCEEETLVCNVAIPGCETCWKTATNQPKCLRCFNDYMLTVEKTCKKLNESDCRDKDPGCIDCKIDAASGDFWCNKCLQGYYPSSFGTCIKEYENDCLEKIPGCMKCAEVTIGAEPLCEYCKSGYFLSQDRKKCEKVNKCGWQIYGCKECEFNSAGVGKCYKCSDGFLLTSDHSRCISAKYLNCKDFIPECQDCKGLEELRKKIVENPSEFEVLPDSVDTGIVCTRCSIFMKPSDDGKSCIKDTELKCDALFPGCETCINLDYYRDILMKELGAEFEDKNSDPNTDPATIAINIFPKCTSCKADFYSHKSYGYLMCIPQEEVDYCGKTHGDGCLRCTRDDISLISDPTTIYYIKPRCYLCRQGMVFDDNGKCVEPRTPAPNCHKIIPGCRVCYTETDGSIQKCDECYYRYQLNKDFKCDYYPPKCEEFISNCAECNKLPDFEVIIQEIDKALADGSSSDTISKPERPICKRCYDGYELSDDGYYCKPKKVIGEEECKKMFKFCVHCGTPTAPPGTFVPTVIQCLKCEEGFYPSPNGMECIEKYDIDRKCSTLFPNCLKCELMVIPTAKSENSATTDLINTTKPPEILHCYECKPGYYPEGNACISEEDKKKEEEEKESNNCDNFIAGCIKCTIPEIPEIPKSTDGTMIAIDPLPPTCQKCVSGMSPSANQFFCLKEEKKIITAATENPGKEVDDLTVECPDYMNRCARCEEVISFTTDDEKDSKDRIVCRDCPEGYMISSYRNGCDAKEKDPGCTIDNCQFCATVNYFTDLPPKLICAECVTGYVVSPFEEDKCIKFDEEEKKDPNSGGINCDKFIKNCVECEQRKYGGTNWMALETKCSLCKKGFTLSGNKKRCVPVAVDEIICKPGTYFKDKECKPCSDKCFTCSESADNCTSCPPGLRVDPDTKKCIYGCDEGEYYSKEDKKCKPCATGCERCTSEERCFECEKGYSNNKGICEKCGLENGFFYNDFIKRCFECHKSCKTCSFRSKCDTCQDELEIKENGLCGEKKVIVNPESCKENEFYAEKKQECYPCDPSCSTCKGPGNRRCTACDESKGLELFGGKCLCKLGTFMNSDGECQACFDPVNCGRCFGPEQTQCYRCRDKGYIHVDNQCINCAEPTKSTDNQELYDKHCLDKVTEIQLTEEEGIPLNEEIIGPANQDEKLGRLPDRRVVSSTFAIEIGDPDKINQEIFEGEDDQELLRKLMKVTIEGYEEGKDYDIEYHKSKTEAGKVSFDIKCHKDIIDTTLKAVVDDPGALRNDPVYDNLTEEEKPLEEEWSGEFEEASQQGEGEKALEVLKEAGYNIDEMLTGVTKEEQAQADGSYRNDPTSEENKLEKRRNLQTSPESTQGPIIKKAEYEFSFSGRKIPTEKSLQFAEKFGKFFNIFMICLFTLGLILSFFKLKYNVNFDGYFIQLVVLIEFLARTALIDVNYGHLLSVFFDQVYRFDAGMIMKNVDESGLRENLKGKLREYMVPIMVLNSIPVALILYIITSITSLIVGKVSKSITTKRVVSSVQFVIMSITLLDIVFYCSVQLGQHNLGNRSNKFGNYLSLALSIVGILFIIFDISKFLYYSLSKTEFENQEKTEESLKENIYVRFASLGWKPEIITKSRFICFINTAYILRFALAQVFIASLQSNPNLTCWFLIALNIIYLTLLIIAAIKFKKYISSGFEIIQKIILEICLMVFLIMVKVFESDPYNKKFSSTKTEGMQKFVMILLLGVVLSQVVAFVVAVLREFKEKKKKVQEDVDEPREGEIRGNQKGVEEREKINNEENMAHRDTLPPIKQFPKSGIKNPRPEESVSLKIKKQDIGNDPETDELNNENENRKITVRENRREGGMNGEGERL